MKRNISASIRFARFFVPPLRQERLSYLRLTPLGKRPCVTRLTTLTVRLESQFRVVELWTMVAANTPKCPTSFGLAAQEVPFKEASGITILLPVPIKNKPTPLPRL